MTTSAEALPLLQGSELSLLWAVPFAGLLLSIALLPIFARHFWHTHYGKIAAAWAVVFLVPFVLRFGASETAHHVAHALLLEYVPFLIILWALYTIAGGIAVRGTINGTPPLNTALLALGAALASVMGTTGASMLLIRPLLAANERRRHKAHLVVFFILLVGNIGGALTPLGDPPLFIGFLKGVDFFWTTRALAVPTLLLVAVLLGVFYALDCRLQRNEPALAATAKREPVRLEGSINFLLVATVVGAVLLSGLWNPGVEFEVLGASLEVQHLARDALLIALALASLAITPAAVREHNAFHWSPMVEVAKLFAAIFITIIPVIAMLSAGRSGAFATVVAMVTDGGGEPRNAMYFWTTGVLSAFLDNAPTYLVFFNLAGGDAAILMGPGKATLGAISMAAVFFGALTYVGNAPNFMIRAIAEDRGVAMPSFFGYLAWACVILLPLLAVVAAIFL
jgi:Na+/H+ antiporter NhaD/arsenite permease-like protein